MKITLDIKKSIEQNASDYFEKAKKLKKKLSGAKEVIAEQEKKLEKLKKEMNAEIEKEKLKKEKEEIKKQRQKEKAWYEKFHWFFTSEGFLAIAGKDATSNEIVVKKHAEKGDLIFHTEEPGSPFLVLKCKGKCGDVSINEAAQECAVYSKAWKRGFSPVVYYVDPDQVTKQAKTGEYVAKGAFMVYGKRNFVKDFRMQLAIGVNDEGKVIGGPVTSINAQTKNYAIVNIGDTKKSDLAKKIKKKTGGDVDEIMLFLPGDGELE